MSPVHLRLRASLIRWKARRAELSGATLSRYVVEILEPRILLSADPLGGLLADAALPPVPDLGDATTDDLHAFLPPAEAPEPTSVELVFIDAGAPDHEQLLRDLRENSGDRRFDVVVLEANRDGFEQISETLSGYTQIDAVHIISHGSQGEIALGNSVLDLDSLSQHADALTHWGTALSEDADLLFYGCDLAGSADGASLIDRVSTLTGADVAASDDRTGAAALGGDWDLEHRSGQVDTAIAFSADLQRDYASVLPLTFTVNSLLDTVDINPGDGVAIDVNGNTSLRAAIMEANALAGSDVISLPSGTYQLSIGGLDELADQGDLDITEALTIQGGGSGSTTIDAQGIDRIFNVKSTNVLIQDVSLVGGVAGSDLIDGGAVLLELGSTELTLERVVISGNSAEDGGGIFSNGTLTLREVTLDSNVASQNGGGVRTPNGTGTIVDSTFSNNDAGTGGGLHTGTNVTVTNSTFSGNDALIASGGGIRDQGDLTLLNVTVTRNTAVTSGGGIAITGGGSTLTTSNSLFADNTAGSAVDLSGTVISDGSNFIKTSAGSGGFAVAERDVDPLLDPVLRDNGGPTQTHALMAGSQAIDATNAVATTPNDQRGYARVSTPDLGAYEFAAGPVSLDSDGDGLLDSQEDSNADLDNDPSTNPGPDTDGDTVANYLDPDDDGDGTPTSAENADPNADGDPRDALDSDFDGVPDYLDAPTIASDGTVSSEQKISATAGGFSGSLDADDRFGQSVTAIGDLDGDGITDLAVGAVRDDDGGTDRGAVYILFMNSDGTVRSEQKISDLSGGLTAALSDGDYFGRSVAQIGDLDGDGTTDLAVGANQDADGGASRGAVYILFMNADGTVKAEQKISGLAGGLSATPTQFFGAAVAGLGDIDGDGINDIAVGAPRDDSGGTDRGALYVLLMNSDGTVAVEQKIVSGSAGLSTAIDDDDRFGSAVAGIGDLDGDGINDLVVGAQLDDDGGSDRGAVRVLFLNSDGTVRSEQKISSTAGGLNPVIGDGARFGVAVAGIGDIDADGVEDIAVSAGFADDGGPDRGAVHVLMMNTDGTVRAIQRISATDGGLTGPLDDFDRFGSGLAGLGDLNGDGTIDLAVGANQDDDGGGSNRGAVYILNTTANTAPTDIAPNSFSIVENTDTSSGVSLGTLTATDPNTNESLGWSIEPGGDAGNFTIGGAAGDELILSDGVLDYESKGSYLVNVRATDSAGNVYDEALTVDVTDVNEAPTVSLTPVVTNLDEDTDTSSAIVVATIAISDDALGTNNLTLSGTDAALFEIVGSDLRLRAGSVLDFESNPSLDVTVEVDDPALAPDPDDAAAYAVTINDVNEAPTVSLTPVVTNLDEDADTSTAITVATIAIADDALGTNNLTLSGTDAALFEIVGSDLRLRAGTALDFESNPSLDVTVEVDDPALAPDPDETAAYAVTINDINEAPTVSLTPVVTNLDEDADTSTAITVATIAISDDALGTNNLTLSGTDAALFEIVGSDLRLRAGTVLDFEANASLDVTVEVDDPALAPDPDDTAAYAVTINDVNEAPTVSLTSVVTNFDEDADTSTAITVATIAITDDALGTNNLTLSGTDAALFEIVGADLRLRAGSVLDFESNPSLDVTVEVDDPALATNPDDTAAYAVTINDVNEAPTVSLTPVVTNLDEDADTTSAITIATIALNDDALGTNNLTLSGTDAALFEIVGSDLRIRAGSVLDFETNASLDVTVEVDDPALAPNPDDTAAYAVTINDVNEAPTVSLTSVVTNLDEDADTTSAIVVATIAVADDALGTNNLTLSGADAALFEIVGSDLRLRAGSVLDFESNASLDVTVEVDDPALATNPDDMAAYAVTINDVNEAPTVSLTSVVTNLDEDADTSTAITVATIAIADDAPGTNNLTLSGTDVALFEIVGSDLRLRAGTVLDFESNPSLDVTVEIDDPALAPDPDDTAAYAVTINDVNEAPTVSLTPVVTNLDEDADTSSAITVATIAITDDALGTNNLTLSGTDAALFEIVGSDLRLRAGSVLDFESNASLDVTVEVDDPALAPDPDDTAAYAVTIDDVNEAPTVSLSNQVTSISDTTDTSSRIKMADIVILDDALGTNGLTLSGADAGLFEIVGGTELHLRAGTVLDSGANAVLDVTVEVDDAAIAGAPDDVALLSVSVTAGNNAPTVTITPGVTNLDESADTSSAIVVGTIVVTDDGFGTNNLSLSGTDAGLFEIVGTDLRLRAGTVLDFETNASLDVNVEVDDPGLAPDPDDTAAYAVAINDVNEAPTVSLTPVVTNLDEDADTTSATTVATISVTDDALGTNNLTLSGTDAALFEIVGSDLRLRAGTALDFEANPSLDVTVEVDDPALAPNPDDTAAYAVTINDVNEAPTVSLTPIITNLDEATDTSSAIVVATIALNDDALGTNNPTLSGADVALFEIVGSDLRLRAGTVLDVDTNPALDVTVEVNDPSLIPNPNDATGYTVSVSRLIPPFINPEVAAPPAADETFPVPESRELDAPEEGMPETDAEPDGGGEPETNVDDESTLLFGEIPGGGSTPAGPGSFGIDADSTDGGDPLELTDSNPATPPQESAMRALLKRLLEPTGRERLDAIFEEFDELRRELGDDSSFDRLVMGSLGGTTSVLAAGYVLWLIRGGALAASVLSSLPAWHLIDPLPILANVGPAWLEGEEDESLEEMVQREPPTEPPSEKHPSESEC